MRAYYFPTSYPFKCTCVNAPAFIIFEHTMEPKGDQLSHCYIPPKRNAKSPFFGVPSKCFSSSSKIDHRIFSNNSLFCVFSSLRWYCELLIKRDARSMAWFKGTDSQTFCGRITYYYIYVLLTS